MSAVVVMSVCCLPDLISVVSTCQYVHLSFHPMQFVLVATCLLRVCYTRLLEVAHGTYMRINTSTIYMHDTVYNLIRYTLLEDYTHSGYGIGLGYGHGYTYGYLHD